MTVDTVFALASGRPPAAIAIVRISGPASHTAGRLLAGDLPEARQAAVRTLRSGTVVLDQALVLRFDAPASATGEDVVEFHCHGGRAVVDAVLAALASMDGLRSAEPGEFTRQAFDNGRIDLTEAEGLADLLEAETESQRRAALVMANGGLRRQIEDWQTRVLALSARAEAAIDYDEEDGLGQVPALAADCLDLAGELESWLARPRVEPLRDGIKVVLAGPPNSGKSSLLNAIAGEEKAIVTNVPGTTRDRIEVPLSVGGLPMLLTDTAGLRESEDAVEQVGVERARQSIAGADIIIWLGEPDAAPHHRRLIVVHPRCDLPERKRAPAATLPISSVTGEGLGDLLQRVGSLAKEILPTEGALALNRRQADQVSNAAGALRSAAKAPDLPIAADGLLAARRSFDLLTGRAGVEDLLDTLFGRFCLGK